MAYIYRKKLGNKNYFYLRISKRVKGKVVCKDVAYLGSDISSLTIEKLEKEFKQYSEDIRKGYKKIRKTLESEHFIKKAEKLKLKHLSYFSKDERLEIEACRVHYDQFQKIDNLTKEEVYSRFSINFSVDSSAIEGNTITQKEAFRLIEEGELPSKKSLREVYEVRNSKRAFDYILKEELKFNEKLILKIHKLIVSEIDKRVGYRKHEVRIAGSKTKVTPYPYIKSDMDLLLKWFNKNKKKLHPLALASLFHLKFEKIHPFADGNGRVGRVLIILILMKNKYPPFIIRKNKRKEYLKSFEDQEKLRLDENEPSKKMLNFFQKEFIETYWSNFLI